MSYLVIRYEDFNGLMWGNPSYLMVWACVTQTGHT